MSRKTKRPNVTATTTVYTPVGLPPRRWAAAPDVSELAKHAWLGLLRPGYIHPSDYASYVNWWHVALASVDSALIASLQSVVHANNEEVRTLAHNLDLGVKSHRASNAVGEVRVNAHLVQFDAGEMARRIEAASARHRNRDKGARGHKNANRHLKYACTKCGRIARLTGSDRVVMCGGTFDNRHEPSLMEYDPASEPAYRQADKSAAYLARAIEDGLASDDANPDDAAPFIGATTAGLPQSALQTAAARARAALAQPPAKPERPDGLKDVIPF